MLAMLACDRGPSVGDRIPVDGGTTFYRDESLFRAAVQLEGAKSNQRATSLQTNIDGKWTLLDGVTHVRVLEKERGGAKVVVEKGAKGDSSEGKIGWVLDKDLNGPEPE